MFKRSYLLIAALTIAGIIHQSHQQFETASKMAGNIVNYEYVANATKNNNIYIIDVREPGEIDKTGKIPNSINIPVGQVEEVLKTSTEDEFKNKYGRTKPGKETELIFSCQSGMRAAKALEMATKLGYNNSKSYQGSWSDWSKHNPK